MIKDDNNDDDETIKLPSIFCYVYCMFVNVTYWFHQICSKPFNFFNIMIHALLFYLSIFFTLWFHLLFLFIYHYF